MNIIDLRSDTVTQPTPAMRQAIANAEVGDDVIGNDPTVLVLESETAELLGKEAAIFMPSGSMTNQVAIRLHCGRGDEFICESDCHVYNYEQAAFAQLSGVVARTVQGDGGILKLEQLVELIRPENDHLVRTRLVSLENTHNRGSGRIQPFEDVAAICNWAHEHGLKTHLDGARLWNAAVATGIPERSWADLFESVSVCFSKGLGAPVGSCLAGTRDLIRDARRARKLFGGGMRQAGILAAGALYALRNHHDRLHIDHQHAQQLAAVIDKIEAFRLLYPVDTNIIIFQVSPRLGTAAEYLQVLEQHGLRALSVSRNAIRLVTHLDVDADQINRAGEILQKSSAMVSTVFDSNQPSDVSLVSSPLVG